MKLKFTDGYIETKASGNTICGVLAHTLYHIAEEIARDNKADFQLCLNTVLKEYKKIRDNKVKELISL